VTVALQDGRVLTGQHRYPDRFVIVNTELGSKTGYRAGLKALSLARIGAGGRGEGSEGCME